MEQKNCGLPHVFHEFIFVKVLYSLWAPWGTKLPGEVHTPQLYEKWIRAEKQNLH